MMGRIILPMIELAWLIGCLYVLAWFAGIPFSKDIFYPAMLAYIFLDLRASHYREIERRYEDKD